MNLKTIAKQKNTSTDAVELITAKEALNWLALAIDESNEEQRRLEEWRRKH